MSKVPIESIPPEYRYLVDPRLKTEWNPFALLAFPLNMQVQLPCSILGKYQLRNLTDIEVDSIRVFLREQSGSPFIGGGFETKFSTAFNNETANNSGHQHLEGADCRYFGLCNSDGGSISVEKLIDEVYKPSLMMDVEFLTPIIKDSPGSTSVGAYDLSSILRLGGTPHTKIEYPLNKEYFNELENLSISLASNQNHEFSYAMSLYSDLLHNVNRRHRLYLLGLYVILESLVTHNPEARAAHGLAHQIEYKMPLIMKRFHKPLDTGVFLSTGKLWEKLYKLRNILAHGGILPDDGHFKQDRSEIEKKLAPLKSLRDVRIFLEQTVRSVLRFSLEEPELQQDLRVV